MKEYDGISLIIMRTEASKMAIDYFRYCFASVQRSEVVSIILLKLDHKYIFIFIYIFISNLIPKLVYIILYFTWRTAVTLKIMCLDKIFWWYHDQFLKKKIIIYLQAKNMLKPANQSSWRKVNSYMAEILNFDFTNHI